MPDSSWSFLWPSTAMPPAGSGASEEKPEEVFVEEFRHLAFFKEKASRLKTSKGQGTFVQIPSKNFFLLLGGLKAVRSFWKFTLFDPNGIEQVERRQPSRCVSKANIPKNKMFLWTGSK